MAEPLLYQSGTVTITPSTAHFHETSYQIANITSAGIYYRRAYNPIAVLAFVLGLLALLFAYLIQDINFRLRAGISLDVPQYTTHIVIGGALLLLGAILIQRIWPVITRILVLKTSGGEIQRWESQDDEHIRGIKAAVEYAFALRLGSVTIVPREAAPPVQPAAIEKGEVRRPAIVRT
jgi:hypothetical protein